MAFACRSNPRFDNLKIGYDNNADDDIDDVGDDVVVDEAFGGTSLTVAHDHAGNLIDDGKLVYVYDAWNRLVKVRASSDADRVIQEAEYDGTGRRIKKIVTNSGDFNGTFVYIYDGWKIAQVNDGSGYMVQQFIHGTQYIDELVMMRAAGRGDLYVHQGESRQGRDERERPATGNAGTTPASGPRVCPQEVLTTSTTGGANWNVIALTDLGGGVVERSTYTPYGELTVHQGERDQGESVNAKADRDGGERSEREPAAIGKASRKRASGRRVCPQGVSTTRATGGGIVDATDKGTPGVTCTGTVSGACRILDLDFDGAERSEGERPATGKAGTTPASGPRVCPQEVLTTSTTGGYDSADATLFDALPAGLARHPGRTATGVRQLFGHQGILIDSESALFFARQRSKSVSAPHWLQPRTYALIRSAGSVTTQPFSLSGHYGLAMSLFDLHLNNPFRYSSAFGHAVSRIDDGDDDCSIFDRGCDIDGDGEADCYTYDSICCYYIWCPARQCDCSIRVGTYCSWMCAPDGAVTDCVEWRCCGPVPLPVIVSGP